MDVRAAVATAAGKPLEITTVQLEGPRDGEVMVEVKATGAGSLPPRLGPVDRHRRGTLRRRDCHAAVPARDGRVWKGTAFGGARGRTDVPKIVDWYMQGKIQIDPMITHVMPLAEINNAFELMKRGESIRGVVTF